MKDTPRSLTEHLEELRRRTIRSLVAFAAATVLGFLAADWVLDLLTEAGRVPPLAILAVGEGLAVRVRLALALGVAISFPAWVYEAVAFVLPALKREERVCLFTFLPLSVTLFAGGIAFAFLLVLPAATGFLLRFAGETLQPVISVSAYVSFVLGLLMPFGFVFQLPVVAALLARLGLVSPRFLARHRQHAVLMAFIVAAILTPPDVVSQVLLAVPLLILYEASLLASRLSYRPRQTIRPS